MRKGQIQMGESIAVVIIVIILLVMGIVFWAQVNKEDVKTSQQEFDDASVVELAKTASELPELRCYKTETVVEVNCFDWYKILALNYTLNNHEVTPEAIELRKNAKDLYRAYFGASRITFSQVYPSEINITVYDYNTSSLRTPRIYIPIIFEKDLGVTTEKTMGWIIVEGYR